MPVATRPGLLGTCTVRRLSLSQAQAAQRNLAAIAATIARLPAHTEHSVARRSVKAH